MHCQTVPALFKTHHHCVVCVCGVRVHVRVCVRACVGGGSARTRQPEGTKGCWVPCSWSWVAMSCPMWMLRTELGSS